MHKHSIILLFSIVFFWCSCSSTGSREKQTLEFPLKDYVIKKDDSFSYTVVGSISGDGWREYKIHMTSGNWLSDSFVGPVLWWHWINVIVPDQIEETEAMMIIGGGDSQDPGSG